MSVQTDPTGQIQVREKPKDSAANLMALIERMKPEMARALPKHVTPDRMARIVLTAIRTTPRLAECSPSSFLACAMSLAQLGLEPNTPLGFAYLIPRNMKKPGSNAREMTCTLIIGYQGMMELARRSGHVSSLYAHLVKQGDDFRYALGTEPMIHHVPSEDPERESKPVTHVYAVAKLRDGGIAFSVLSMAQVISRRNRSMAKNDGPWITDLEAMILKTGMRALFPWVPKSAEIARAEALELAVDTGRPILAAADEAVAALLSSAAVEQADREASEAKPAEDGESSEKSDPEGEGTNNVAEVDALAKRLGLSSSERNELVIKHKGDFKAALADLVSRQE